MKARHDQTDWLPGFSQAMTDERAATPAPTHPWDTGGRGPTGSAVAGVPILFCPRCRVTFYLRADRPRCPSCSRTPATPAP